MAGKDKDGITVLYDPQTDLKAKEGHATNCPVTFDLVAIHGLNGDAIDTWTHKKTGVMWLEDLLPQALPNIRVMTFGYNARFKNFTAQRDLLGISQDFLYHLSNVRVSNEEMSRPIVLVCHSLGGIIAKKALIIDCPEREGRIQESAYGIFFLGTPHNGTNLVVMAKLMANIVSACSPITPPRSLIRTLQKDSGVLLEITKSFVERRKKIRLVSFYELELTSIGPFLRKLIVEQQSAVLNLPEETSFGQYADHRGIVRFRSLQDRSFRPVLARLKIFAQELEDLSIGKASPGSERGITFTEDSAIPFDIPMLPCSSFRGRDDILGKLSAYFLGNPDKLRTRRTFAICGLGGSGKTQTALHYVTQNMLKYRTGVLFLNATSQASVAADFARLHDLLKLKESNNKISAVRSWLSKKENSQWLMVFDNADNLSSVPIHQYLPATNWGHVIITSRDQATIGGVTDEGHVLNPLTSEDAAELLLERSGIRDPSQSESEYARSIANLLGSLPLALVQAGGFVRSRHKSLKKYHELYLSRRQDLLDFEPRLKDSDKAVLTTWEVNFKQLEQESQGATHLLFLFAFLEPSSIPEMVLHRGSSPQRRWGKDGEMTEVSAEQEGVDGCLIKVIQDDFGFDLAVEKLLSFSLISCNKESDGLRNFSIHPLVQYCITQRLSPSEANRWRWQAILLVCHAFPRNRYIEPLNYEVGSTMLSHLSRVLSEYDSMCINHEEQTLFRHELAATILAASRFSDAKWKVEAIDRVKKLLDGSDDHFLNAWLAYRESAIMRMSGMAQESHNALQKFIQCVAKRNQGEDSETTSRFNAQRGDLIISFSENFIRQSMLNEAKVELLEWRPLNPERPSTLEKITSRARDIMLGKIFRYQGLFEHALPLLEKVFQNSILDDFFEGTGWHRVLVSVLADLYCELGRPIEAEKLLQLELTPMRESGSQDVVTGRRLQMSLAEAYLQRNMYDEAESILMHLKYIFSSTGGPAFSVNSSMFRVWISLARVSHRKCCWSEALSRWTHALSTAELLKQGGGFGAGIVRCSMAHALMMTGDETESMQMLQQAKVNMDSEPRIFWVPLFTSQWHDFITHQPGAGPTI